MIVHQVYAQIFEEEVRNITVCDNYSLANQIAKATYGDEAYAVDCLQYRCGIGDIYRDGRFFTVSDDGIEIPVVNEPTQEQEVEKLKHETEIMAEYQMEIDYRVSCQELGL